MFKHYQKGLFQKGKWVSQ